MSEAACTWFTTYKYYEIIQACNALFPIRSSQVKARGRYGEGEDRQSNIIIDLQTTRIGGKKKEKKKKEEEKKREKKGCVWVWGGRR